MKKQIIKTTLTLILIVLLLTPSALAASGAEIYAHNISVSETKRDDLAALSYYLEPSDRIQSGDAAIRALAAEITDGITDAYAKVLVIHNWVAENIYYDYDAYYGDKDYGDSSAVGVLAARRSVCEGYANLTAALLRAAGIPAKRILGYALGLSTGGQWPAGFDPDETINHAWNEAYADGRWIILDATWDSPGRWEYGGIARSGPAAHCYFDADPAVFAEDHAIQNYSESAIDAYAAGVRRWATPSAGPVLLDGEPASALSLYLIDGSSYIKLRDIAALLSAAGEDIGIGWDAAAAVISIIPGDEYRFTGEELSGAPAGGVWAGLPAVKLSYDGEPLFLRAFSINGSTYFRLRDLAALLGFGVDYDAASKAVIIGLGARLG